MDENAAAYEAEGGGVEVEGAVEGFPSGEEGSDGGLAEKVEGDFDMREEFIPQVVWEGGRDAGEDAEEVSFEGADGTFGYVAPMDIEGYQLVCSPPYVGDVAALFLAGFVVEDLMINDVAARLEAGHDAGVGRYAVAVFSCLEGLDEDGVCIAMVGHHQILVAAAGADGEAACVVRVERVDGFHP